MFTFDQLCRGLEVDISAFAICEVRQDATFVLAEDKDCAIHYVLSGEGVVWRATGEAAPLTPHTVMIVPPGSRVTITSDPDQSFNLVPPKCEPLEGDWALLQVGDSAPGLVLACGYINARYMQVVELFEYLREPLIESVAEDRSFREPFNNLLKELSDPKPGTKVLAEMLMKQCLISLLRSQSEANGQHFAPWLAALGNPSLGRALTAMLENPEANHTLESLGDIAGMSRGSFAEHFREAFGRTAIECLKEIRLRRAAQLLTATDLPVKTIAYRVGFESRSYFSRAFKSFAGIDPAGYRANPVVHSLNPGRNLDGHPGAN
jgi:AraC-like DNA-binding protein